MHKLLITDPAGVVISTKHHPVGSIIPNVPRGIAKACLHFKQAKDLNAPEVRTDKDDKGTALEVFTKHVKTALVDEYGLSSGDAASLLTENTHLVGLGAIGGLPAVEQTAFALVQTLAGPTGRTKLSPHPAARMPQVAGAAPTGGDVIVSNQPMAPSSQPVATGGGNIATLLSGAGADLGTDQPTPLQQATADAEKAEVTVGAEAKGKSKSRK